MFDEKVLSILKEKILFMGTVCNNVPRVRPMRPFVDENNTIWLISHTNAEKNKEIEMNNIVELCTLSDNNDVLRLQGSLVMEKELNLSEVDHIRQQIIEKFPQITDFFTGSEDTNMVIYKFLVKKIIFRSLASTEKAELNFRPSVRLNSKADKND